MNILCMPAGRDGCSGYRMRNPMNSIEGLKQDGVQAMIIDSKDSGEDIIRYVQGADIIFFRPGQERVLEHIKKNMDCKNKVFVIDLDDDLFNINPFSPTYRWGGTEEVEYEGKKLWEDGVAGFSIENNIKGLNRLIDAIKEADLVTVTTEYLKNRIIEEIRQYQFGYHGFRHPYDILKISFNITENNKKRSILDLQKAGVNWWWELVSDWTGS